MASIVAAALGCGGDVGSDPVERSQTELDAKNAMQTQSKKRSEAKTPQQNTRNAMEAGARQQKQSKPN
jgi:hypothetical protein